MNKLFEEYFQNLIKNSLQKVSKDWERERTKMTVKDMENELNSVDFSRFEKVA